MFHRTKRITPMFLSIFLLMIAGVGRIALGDPEPAPALLQQQAIQRNAFMDTNDLALAALSLIKRGDIKRMQDHMEASNRRLRASGRPGPARRSSHVSGAGPGRTG